MAGVPTEFPLCGELRRVVEERQDFHPTGHLNWGDVFTVQVDRRRLEAVHFTD
ncbi:MAG: hypothetical protein M3P89_10330 [Actinomycetota bacterium]|nr:hypothetical protein [Actinomycetota bacterium]